MMAFTIMIIPASLNACRIPDLMEHTSDSYPFYTYESVLKSNQSVA